MKQAKADKKISSFFLVITLALFLYGISISGFVVATLNQSFVETFFYLFKFYLDFILILYVFICLQIAGYVELKYKQDYLMISIISILFTPLSIFFVINSENKDD
jgi:hypothetical protein|tara:strand:+ start:113 stop:427 length:315 start_codon:yes stop_codon:yes gene_type:complete